MATLGERVKGALITKTPVGVTFCRLGNQNDGGYVVVDDFTQNDHVISMGVAYDVSFEKALEGKVSWIDAYDYSVNNLPEPIANSRFFKERIGADSAYVFDRVPKGKDLILKIDIEGGEWAFFESLSEEQVNRFRQIAVEIHWSIQNPYASIPEVPVDILEKLLKTHQVVVVHPNNYGSVFYADGLTIPQVIEITLLRRSSYEFLDSPFTKPQLLRPNDPARPELESDVT